MIYFVTGGCGFIGSHLVKALCERGDQVIVLDDLSTGKRENLPAGVTFVEGSVCDPRTVSSLMESVDGCFHLAAVASVQKSVENWFESSKVNAQGAIAVFESSKNLKKRIPIVYASSAAVYGAIDSQSISEDDPKTPLTAYAVDKLASELHAKVAGVVHDIQTVGLRFFNVYGPGQDSSSPYSGVISIFMDRISRGLPITIYGDGEQTRDFVYVGDVVTAMLIFMECASVNAPVFNVCTGRSTSINRLAESIMKILNINVPIEYAPSRIGDIYKSVGNPYLMTKLTNFSCAVDLLTGLEKLSSHAGIR